MTEPGRVPPLLRLCRGCRQFVRPDDADCPFCGGDLNMLQADYEKRVANMRHAAAELREALARLTGHET
jgi:rRNA maturation endonuclease Nob1